MKTISIKQLHETTGKFVREARVHPILITDHGNGVALLKRFSADDVPGKRFPNRKAADLPSVDVDSTGLISEDRDS
ncbi:MAG: hypothetical protein JXR37_05920 [Kiritimatiellae bacterium]|nr:hypothetical protein [Kiritimatiellia bacterium]